MADALSVTSKAASVSSQHADPIELVRCGTVCVENEEQKADGSILDANPGSSFRANQHRKETSAGKAAGLG